MPSMEEKLEEKARARQERERLDALKLAAAQPSAASRFCTALTIFMACFVFGDIVLQLTAPSMPVTSATLTSAVSAVATTLSGAAALPLEGPVGAAKQIAADGVWLAGWSALAVGKATLGPSPSSAAILAHFPPPQDATNAAVVKLTGVSADVPGFVVRPSAAAGGETRHTLLAEEGAANASASASAPQTLSAGTILQMRLRAVPGASAVSDTIRAVELSLGATSASFSSPLWSAGALLYTLAPELLSSPGAFQEAALPLPRAPAGTEWTHLRLRYVACDLWGHAMGDIDCDPASPPPPLALELASVSLVPATAAARAAATRRLCEPALLLEGRGISSLLPDVCPISALYKPIMLPADGRISGLSLAGSAGASGGTRPLPLGGLEGRAQGFRCEEVMARTTLGAKLARGWSTHKSVYRGTYRPSGGGKPVAAVVKEGGLRYPPPAQGERGVGFGANQSAEEQKATLQTMWFEMEEEILISELLGSSHPGIPLQLGACVDSVSLLATSVQAMGGVHLRRKADLSALAAGSAVPAVAAMKLARSAASLFYFLAEERALRMEDLHFQMYDLRGNVRTNFSDAAGGGYSDDDLSQFTVDSAESLNLQLIDLDKILISHEPELRWYVAEVLMPFVAAQLFQPLSDSLPALSAVATPHMLQTDPLLRPPSFKCLLDWFDAATTPELLAAELPCDPAVYNEGRRSRWVDAHYG